MNLRLATIKDLPKLKAVYGKIVDNMNRSNINIWDDVYPSEFFIHDIQTKSLYVLVGEDDDIVAAFTLGESNKVGSCVKWERPYEKGLYLGKLGVNVDYLRSGIGNRVLKDAIELTKQRGAKYLRLYVVDINKPAINLYVNNGFKQADGIHEETVDDFVLCEYGFEIEV